MMFTQAYAAAPISSPTRASIVTSLYPARIGMTLPHGHAAEVVLEQRVMEKAWPDVKALQCNTVAHLKLEYFTLDVGMPHTPQGAPVGGYFAPWRFWPGQGKPGENIEGGEEAMRFIRANKDRPFF
jgi:arylsulfatase A-like enzyme